MFTLVLIYRVNRLILDFDMLVDVFLCVYVDIDANLSIGIWLQLNNNKQQTFTNHYILTGFGFGIWITKVK